MKTIIKQLSLLAISSAALVACQNNEEFPIEQPKTNTELQAATELNDDIKGTWVSINKVKESNTAIAFGDSVFTYLEEAKGIVNKQKGEYMLDEARLQLDFAAIEGETTTLEKELKFKGDSLILDEEVFVKEVKEEFKAVKEELELLIDEEKPLLGVWESKNDQANGKEGLIFTDHTFASFSDKTDLEVAEDGIYEVENDKITFTQFDEKGIKIKEAIPFEIEDGILTIEDEEYKLKDVNEFEDWTSKHEKDFDKEVPTFDIPKDEISEEAIQEEFVKWKKEFDEECFTDFPSKEELEKEIIEITEDDLLSKEEIVIIEKEEQAKEALIKLEEEALEQAKKEALEEMKKEEEAFKNELPVKEELAKEEIIDVNKEEALEKALADKEELMKEEIIEKEVIKEEAFEKEAIKEELSKEELVELEEAIEKMTK